MSPDRRSRLVHKLILACLIVYWPCLFLGTHISADELMGRLGAGGIPPDKSAHVGACAVLGILICLASGSKIADPRRRLTRRMGVAAIVVPLYALFDEITQPLTNRHFDWLDILADLVGGFAAVAIVLACTILWHPKWEQRPHLTP